MASPENTVPENPSKEVPELQAACETSKDTNPKVEVPVDRPPSTASSGSNSESLSAYAERTVAAIAQRDSTVADPTLDHTPLVETPAANDKAHKESESSTIEVAPKRPPNIEGQDKTDGRNLDSSGDEEEGKDGRKTASRPTIQDLFSTDASEFEDLLDGSGVSGPVLRGAGSGFFTVPSSSQEEEEEIDLTANISADPIMDLPGPTTSTPTQPRQLSVSGRAALRKCFTENRPIKLPIGHPVVAFSEGQIHTVLRTISDESLLSSFHLMKSLLLQAADGKVITKERCRHVRRSGTPHPDSGSSSGGECNETDLSSGAYTSGAFNSDEDPGSLDVQIEFDQTPQVVTPRKKPSLQDDTGPMMLASPGSGYSVEDYAPLSRLLPKTADKRQASKPPAKRRRVATRPGKVMKEAYFKGIRWTKTFVTGPLDPVHNQHKFYCQICKTNVSIYSKGAREIIRHYQGESHLRKDQRWRFEHLGVTDQITGITQNQVRGRDGYILTPLELEREKPYFENAPLVNVGEKFPFYDDYIANTGSHQTTEDQRASAQIALIGSFIPHDGNILLRQSLWSKVGEYMNHKEQFSPFDWSSATLTVCILISPFLRGFVP